MSEPEIQFKEPLSGEFADDKTAIVLFNHFGSTVAQDTGRDAQVLANDFNLPVLAVNRPGTTGFWFDRCLASTLSTPDGYLSEMSKLGKRLDRQMEKGGIDRVIATGRSAGALGALALARTETVSSLSAVFAPESVGWKDLPLKEGLSQYKSYLSDQNYYARLDPKTVEPLPACLPLAPAIGRLLSIPPAMAVDKFHSKRLFASDASYQYSEYIAENLTDIDTTLEFANISMVASGAFFIESIIPLARKRIAGAPFVAMRSEHSVHRSYDNRRYMSQRIRPIIERTLAAAQDQKI